MANAPACKADFCYNGFPGFALAFQGLAQRFPETLKGPFFNDFPGSAP
jgi:hypothetical protein